MLKLDFSIAILLYTLLPLLFISIPLFTREEKINLAADNLFIQECSICLYVLRSRKKEKLFQCPVCGSYNEVNPV